MGDPVGVGDGSGTPQSRLNAYHRQDFSYKNLCINDLPTLIQSAIFEDRAKTTNCFVLGENRTEDRSHFHPVPNIQ